MPTGNFANRTILVTGASGGIGGAVVRLLARNGADVIAAASTRESLEPIVAETGARPLAFDLTSEIAVREALHDLPQIGRAHV